jgi:hypothetical protein
MKPRSHKLFSWPDFQRIDLGIAISHFDLSVLQLGIIGEWRISKPDITIPDDMMYIISWFQKTTE